MSLAAPSPALPPLIDATELRALLAPSTAAAPDDVLVLDCRFDLADAAAGEAAWRQGHIPGARHAHLDRDLSGPKAGQGTPQFNGRHPLPSPDALARTLGAWGLRPDTRVVAYDDAGGMFAARAWWLLRWLGHDRVQVLDGGWPAWLALPPEGGAQDTTVAARPTTVVTPRVQAGWVLSAADVHAALGQAQLQLLDARAPDRFRGENETLDPVGGHIPGACNRFFQLNLSEGRFKAPAVLRDEFTALLAQAGASQDTLVHQCGSGVTACHNLLAMAHAGFAPTRLYAGSWSEWCADPGRPVAQGAA
ncbi:MAG: sulfurtransferase [Proteobacteria bacterium]|uniref:sulfurtransferase n=1 Tax=Aquabacterium sp. TaxID=1872578 RepID=UPI0035C69E03|nr:sulfurtransferase [Pseudomonadota bacterium]